MFEKKEKRVLEDLFIREKPALILLALKAAKGSVYATILSKKSDCTYSHTIKILDVLRNYGLVTFEKRGRIKMITLTDDGWDVAHNLEAIQKKLTQIEDKKGAQPVHKSKPELAEPDVQPKE
ncbi:MAG: winged helix DNA-binding protein [Candidatus Aenigmarchaeota archaeon]|nr:winged helix DNA-binding protein [Candidatus Aenigmarchaeota archaeon]